MTPIRKRGLLLGVAVALAGLIGLWLVLSLLQGLAWNLKALFGGLATPLLLVLLGGLGWLAWRSAQPHLHGWSWPPRRRLGGSGPERAVTPFASKREAADQQLHGIEQRLELIRNQVVRQALERERQQVAAELRCGDLQVVVFGTGSSGKTSLIRALLNDVVGEVGAAMGSTTESHGYRLALPGLPRGLCLVDTPGTLEMGQTGQQREALARQSAVQADLLLFVVDGDLRDSETHMLRILLSFGKRLLLVLNKCDLLGRRQEQRLLQVLRNRCTPELEPADVVAASSAPQSLPMPGGRPHQPAPEVTAVLKRLAQVLRLEGEELMADNILLQSRRIVLDTEAVIETQRRRQARGIIDRYSWIGGGVIAVTPLPVLDLLGAAAVNAQMVLELGRIYGIQLSQEEGRELALSVGRTLTGLGLVKGGTLLLTAALTANLPALIAAHALQGVTGAWLTRIAGASFVRYFSHNQNWGDGGMGAAIQQQYDLSRRQAELDGFLTAALQRIVAPLQQRLRQLPPHRQAAPRTAAEQDVGPGRRSRRRDR